jgi:hypothetical protein
VKGPVLLGSVAFGLAFAGTALAVAAFVTPGRAAYCGVSEGEPPLALICWTPNDGFTVAMTARGRPTKRYIAANKGYYDRYVGRVLRFGHGWGWPGYWFCVSRRTGLTCTNEAKHGWWLGRYHGYRLF